MKLSFNMIKNIIKKKEVNMRNYFNKYIKTAIIFTILISITSLYEVFICPRLLKLIIKII